MQNDSILDVQNLADERGVVINKVGIKNLAHPVYIPAPAINSTSIATFDMAVNLAANLKGTHMSRFVEIINEQNCYISIQGILSILNKMLVRLNADTAYLEVSFPYLLIKEAPASKLKSTLNYNVTYLGQHSRQQTLLSVSITVPVITLCPCSKAISKYGAHNQRSIVNLTIVVKKDIEIFEIIKLIESSASCEIYSLLKRTDEKHITEKSYENPKFVEDVVRDISIKLKAYPEVKKYKINVENLESIHNHSAYAEIIVD